MKIDKTLISDIGALVLIAGFILLGLMITKIISYISPLLFVIIIFIGILLISVEDEGKC